jgi:CDP-2,3-bis-(O-geranylgeranyl)-sn-glycerol synthase
MINDILFSIWFFLPAGGANVTPILVANLPGLRDWKTPMDFGLSYRGKRIFGDNKTMRGLVCGVLDAEVIFLIQQKLQYHLGGFTNFLIRNHYTHLSLWLGVLMGLGVILGDALESFFKRQRGIKPGGGWFPFDQLDYIIGGCLAMALIVVLPLPVYIWLIISWFLIHLLFSHLGFIMHLKK